MSLVREDHNVLLSLVVVSVFVDFIFHRESHEKFLQNEKLGVKKKQKAIAPRACDFSRALK